MTLPRPRTSQNLSVYTIFSSVSCVFVWLLSLFSLLERFIASNFSSMTNIHTVPENQLLLPIFSLFRAPSHVQKAFSSPSPNVSYPSPRRKLVCHYRTVKCFQPTTQTSSCSFQPCFSAFPASFFLFSGDRDFAQLFRVIRVDFREDLSRV